MILAFLIILNGNMGGEADIMNGANILTSINWIYSVIRVEFSSLQMKGATILRKWHRDSNLASYHKSLKHCQVNHRAI